MYSNCIHCAHARGNHAVRATALHLNCPLAIEAIDTTHKHKDAPTTGIARHCTITAATLVAVPGVQVCWRTVSWLPAMSRLCERTRRQQAWCLRCAKLRRAA